MRIIARVHLSKRTFPQYIKNLKNIWIETVNGLMTLKNMQCCIKVKRTFYYFLFFYSSKNHYFIHTRNLILRNTFNINLVYASHLLKYTLSIALRYLYLVFVFCSFTELMNYQLFTQCYKMKASFLYVVYDDKEFLKQLFRRVVSTIRSLLPTLENMFHYQILKPLENPEIFRHNRLYVCRIRIKLLTIYKSEILFYCLLIER